MAAIPKLVGGLEPSSGAAAAALYAAAFASVLQVDGAGRTPRERVRERGVRK